MNTFRLFVSTLLFITIATLAIRQATASNILMMPPILAATADITGPNDTSPSKFYFAPKSNISRNSYIISESITVRGINAPTPISINNGDYSIDGGAYTNTPGEIKRGQSVKVRVMSSGNYNSSTMATLIIGNVKGNFKVTTAAPLAILADKTTNYFSGSYIHIIGEVANNTPYYLKFIKVGGSIYNNSNQLIDSDYVFTYLNVLQPGEKTCFHLYFSNTEGATSFWIEQPSFLSMAAPPPKLTGYNYNGFYDSAIESYRTVGVVRNDSGRQVYDALAVGTLYNATGQAIGCSFDYLNNNDLSVGQTSAFGIRFFGQQYEDTASYRLQFDSDF
jgi:hypothetical protein